MQWGYGASKTVRNPLAALPRSSAYRRASALLRKTTPHATTAASWDLLTRVLPTPIRSNRRIQFPVLTFRNPLRSSIVGRFLFARASFGAPLLLGLEFLVAYVRAQTSSSSAGALITDFALRLVSYLRTEALSFPIRSVLVLSQSPTGRGPSPAANNTKHGSSCNEEPTSNTGIFGPPPKPSTRPTSTETSILCGLKAHLFRTDARFDLVGAKGACRLRCR